LGDVTGDGLLDVVAGARFADVGGEFDTETVFVWAGGPTLVGAAAVTARLTIPGAEAEDALPLVSGQAVQLADVTGDEILDVVSAGQFADEGGEDDVEAVYVWQGGAGLAGAPAPTATLTVLGAFPRAVLQVPADQGIQVVDVTDDGVADVVAAGSGAVVESVAAAGAIYVWRGGAALSGAAAPTATLSVPTPRVSDLLGVGRGQGVKLADVTGDGVVDFVGIAMLADADSVWPDTGAIYVWFGGAGLAGGLAPESAYTVAGAVPFDQLGR
jgi:hypothetical protein